MVPWELMILDYLGFGYLLAGKYDKARQTAEELLQLSEGCGARPFIAVAHQVLGEVALPG